MKKILVPVDFSKESMSALQTAASIARLNQDAEVVLLHVVEDPYGPQFNVVGGESHDPYENIFVVTLIEKGRDRLEAIIKSDQYGDVTFHYKIKVGHPYTSISEEIAESKADLIVMGSRGASGIDEVFVGSNTEKVTRHVDCPVITVKEAADLSKVDNIVYATDLREEQEKIVEDIKEMQAIYGAKLHVIKVYDSSFVNEEELQNRIHQFADYFKLKNYTISAVRESDEAAGILRYADQVKAELVAIGAHHRKGLAMLFSPQVAKHVVNHAKIPIWTKKIN